MVSPRDVAERLMGGLTEREVRLLAIAVHWHLRYEDVVPDVGPNLVSYEGEAKNMAEDAGIDLAKDDIMRVVNLVKGWRKS